jgi:hypothetical protein
MILIAGSEATRCPQLKCVRRRSARSDPRRLLKSHVELIVDSYALAGKAKRTIRSRAVAGDVMRAIQRRWEEPYVVGYRTREDGLPGSERGYICVSVEISRVEGASNTRSSSIRAFSWGYLRELNLVSSRKQLVMTSLWP